MMAGQTASKTLEAPSRVIASTKGTSGLEKARREPKDNYRKLKANLAEATRGTSKPVIVAYGPKNARIYKRSTVYRESNIIGEDAKQFGPDHRFRDETINGKKGGKLIRKPREFKGIIGVAYNCHVGELALKAPRKKNDPPSPRKLGVDVWVKWEINGKVERS
ncbi:hypothetical protein V493_01139 [Pseudogymnoascus sp. VKM F-4281 (FW-2241)]|nr:hypothetical protein V493_01139 [Pseudogymnoascus sp. VKM F-4281 (FW-2241)]